MQVTDNGSFTLDGEYAKYENTDNIDDLKAIANTEIGKIKPQDNPDLLIFPPDWNELKKDNVLFSLVENDTKIKTGNIMGFFGYNDTKVTISSRFAQKDDYFLHYMLQKVCAGNLVDMPTTKGEESIFDFYAYLFPYYLKDALSQGLFKKYRHNRYNDANVRGQINVQRHIRQNIPFAGKIAYSVQEYSYDNSMTQLIRHTIEHIKNRNIHTILTQNQSTVDAVKQITSITESYCKNDRQKVITANLKPITHPYYSKYLSLQKLCLKILRYETMDYGHEEDKIYGLLFDGAWLWEEYIAEILRENHTSIEHKTSRNEYRLFTDGQGIVPDFITEIKGTNNASFIGDTKYKPLDTKENAYKREDYFQVISYMYRFSCKTGYLIFPYKENEEKYSRGYKRTINNDDTEKSFVVELGLKIPQSSNGTFGQFRSDMEEAEKIFVNEIEKQSKSVSQ
jgi:5-methylcytosine-specific restriction endonuclease McrBC regulatory subunit McrC